MLEIIIQSQDSAIKLKALLESIDCFLNNIKYNLNIFYQYSDLNFFNGYTKLKNENNNKYNFINSHWAQISIPHQPILLLNDYQLFNRPFIENYQNSLNNPTILFHSKILGKNINNPPNKLIYNYKNYNNEFGLTFLHGNIYNFDDYISLNNLPLNKSYAVIDKFSCLMNIKSYKQPNDYLNEEYLKGKKINITPFMYLLNNDITLNHIYDLEWE
jgi:hypothetical protein